MFAEFGESTPDAAEGEVGGEETGDVGVEAEARWGGGDVGVEAAEGVDGAEDVCVGGADVGVVGAEVGDAGGGDPEGDEGAEEDERVNEETAFAGKVLL